MHETKTDIPPIRDEASHLTALAEIERLWGAPPGTPEGERLDVLVVLVDDYERKNWPEADQDPIDAIVARMENSGRDRKDLEKIVGSSGRVSEILNCRAAPDIGNDLAIGAGMEDARGSAGPAV